MKPIHYVIIALPLLLPGYYVYRYGSQIHTLRTLCATANTGSPIKTFLESAAKTGLIVRTGGPVGKNKDEPFDRDYLRDGERLKRKKNPPDDYTVVYAKPGIGIAGCVVSHLNGSITNAEYYNAN